MHRPVFKAASFAAAVLFHAQPGLSETPLERGTYLVTAVAGCANCHTPLSETGRPIPGMRFAGGRVFDTPVFRAVSANITEDKETGIGNWTDAQIINAIRNGKRPDGTTIGPPMPAPFFRYMSDTDVQAIVAYLRTVKPVHNAVAKSTYKIPLPIAYGPVVMHVPDVPPGDKVAYGRYLAIGVATCMDCHTPDVHGRADMSRIGAGGNLYQSPVGGLIASANLTPGNPQGIATWTDDQVKTAITTGKRPDRPLVPLMPFDDFKHMTLADLDAIVAYLRTLKPVRSE